MKLTDLKITIEYKDELVSEILGEKLQEACECSGETWNITSEDFIGEINEFFDSIWFKSNFIKAEVK